MVTEELAELSERVAILAESISDICSRLAEMTQQHEREGEALSDCLEGIENRLRNDTQALGRELDSVLERVVTLENEYQRPCRDLLQLVIIEMESFAQRIADEKGIPVADLFHIPSRLRS